MMFSTSTMLVSKQYCLLTLRVFIAVRVVPRWCKQTQVEESQLPEVHIPEEDLQNLTPLVTCLYLLGCFPPKLNISTGIWDMEA